MAKKYVISETGEFPAQYKVLHLDAAGLSRPVFGPAPAFASSSLPFSYLLGERARNAKGQLVADDPSTPDVNEAYVGGKKPVKKKTPAKKKAVAKKSKK